MKKHIDSQEIGLAGELRVMSELILRGYNPAKSYIDNGIDFILEDGTKIQVKTTLKKSSDKKGFMSYRFGMRKGNDKKKINPSSYCHFIICWGISDNQFWIIPANKIGNRATISLSFPLKYKIGQFVKYLNNWDILGREVIKDAR